MHWGSVNDQEMVEVLLITSIVHYVLAFESVQNVEQVLNAIIAVLMSSGRRGSLDPTGNAGVVRMALRG
jgi:hypothetical protein